MRHNKFVQFIMLALILVGMLSFLPAVVAQEETPEPQPPATEISTETLTESPPTDIPTETPVTETTPEPQPSVTAEPQPEITAEATANVTINNPDPIIIPPPDNANDDGRGDDTSQIATEVTPIAGAMQRVIVELNVAEGDVRNGLAVPQAFDIQQAQTSLNNAMASRNGFITQSYQLLPLVAMTVDDTTLTYLNTSPLVRAVYPDEIRYLQLDFSTPLIGATTVQASGFDGTGQTIVIIDNGVEATHPFLGGRVVQEACFSTQGATAYGNATTNCPNGSITQYGAGAASPTACVANLMAPPRNVPQATAEDNCSHGTHVAGIAAGEDGSAFSTTFDGVAPNANIIAINVFHTLDSFFGTQTSASDSDILRALEYVLSLTNTYDIASINMSLGGGRYYSACDATYPFYANVVAQLEAAGVAVLAASGNIGYSDSLSAPACVSNIISVGATTTDWNGPGTEDEIAEGSRRMNAASFLDFLAPGYSILSAEMNATYGIKSGTSMATPHMAGAWALMGQASNIATVDQIQTVLSGTGTPITDPRNGFTFPRVNVDTAILEGLVQLGSPSETALGTTTPTFTWQASANTTWYQLLIYNGSSQIFSDWYTAIEAGCNGGGTCTIQIDTAFSSSPGTFNWYVQAWSEAFTGTASRLPIGPETFTLQSPNLQAPSGVLTNIEARPTYQWSSVVNATHYRLYVSKGSTIIIDEWVACAIATCTYQPTTQLSNGSFTWWIVAWGEQGYSPWSTSGAFTINVAPPSAPIPVAPISNPTLNSPLVTFEWQHSAGSSWYLLQVNQGATVVLSKWYKLSDLTPNGGNYQAAVNLTGAGTFTWWVRSFGAAGNGGWSNPAQTFTINPPLAPTNPTFTNQRGDITYQWDHNANITWYELHLTRTSNGSTVFKTWYQVGTSGITCSATCTVNTGNPISNGAYSWRVHSYNASGNSAWTASIPITVSEALPNAGGIGGFQVMDNEVITTHASPTFEWSDIDGASWYQLYVTGPGGVKLNKWYVRLSICTGGTCSINPNLALTNGNYQWWVLPFGPAGSGGWAGPANFTISGSTAITSTQPVLGNVIDVNTSTPSFGWQAVNGATQYRLWISGSGGLKFDKWLNVGATCPSTCAWNDPVILTNGAYTWYIQAYGPGGTSLWSNAGNFTIAIPPPAPVTLIAPANDANAFGTSTTFQWSEVANATWYYIRIWNADNVLHKGVWLQPNVCQSGTCSTTITLPVGDYTWTVASWSSSVVGNNHLDNNPTPRNLTMVN